MKKPVQNACFLLIGIAIITSVCAVCAVCTVSDRVDENATSNFHSMGFLRHRISQLEAELESIKNETDRAIDCICTAEVTTIPSETESCTTEDMSTDTAPESESNPESTADTEPSYSYRVGEYDGKIAVFVLGNGKEQPVRVLNISVATLPSADQAALRDGIHAYNYDQLCEIIDRYE
ncbi:MAG: hypothetical protein E7589_00120 [Ruminococcaceae bacterium]|nr:hypothetical protein [Oscillospiraceae bacterium]